MGMKSITNLFKIRTQEEILERIKETKDEDIFGFGTEILMSTLNFENIKKFLKEDIDKKALGEIKENCKKFSKDRKNNLIREMRNYMQFAWEKVEDHRGLSASRSIIKMTEYLWLLKEDELLKLAQEDDNYYPYGAPILAKICEKLGFPMPKKKQIKNMVSGKPCCRNCDMGC